MSPARARSARSRPAAASHTHSVVKGPEGDGHILVYNSGTSGVRKGEELAGCVGEVSGDDRTALFRIDVIEIPVANPAAARIIDSPAVFADPRTGDLAGLWQGRQPWSTGTQETSVTDQCHDITVFPTRKLAAGACSGNGIIFDISDPRKPRRIDVVSDPGFAYWHSATFNNDGTKVLFTDEWGGGGRPRCRSFDRRDWGANAIYDIDGGKLMRKGTYKLPAPQTEQENCVAHNGSIVPVPGPRYHGPGLVPGRDVDVRLHRQPRAGRDRLFRPRPDRRQAPGHSADTGRPITIAAGSTRPRSRAGSTSSR